MDVVEHDEQRLFAGRTPEEARGRVEQAEACLLGVSGGHDRLAPEKCVELTVVRAARLEEPSERRYCCEASKGRLPWPVGGCPLSFPRASPCDGASARLHV